MTDIKINLKDYNTAPEVARELEILTSYITEDPGTGKRFFENCI